MIFLFSVPLLGHGLTPALRGVESNLEPCRVTPTAPDIPALLVLEYSWLVFIYVASQRAVVAALMGVESNLEP